MKLETVVNELLEVYNTYNKLEVKTDKEKLIYVNTAYNKINLLSKIIAANIAGINVEDDTKVDENKEVSTEVPTTTEEPKSEPKVESFADQIQHEVDEAVKEAKKHIAEEKENEKMDDNNKILELDVDDVLGENQVVKEASEENSETPDVIKGLKNILDDAKKNRSEEEQALIDEKAAEMRSKVDEYASMDIKDLFKMEINLWKPNLTNYAGAMDILACIKMCKEHPEITHKSDYKDILNALSETTHKTTKQIEKNLNTIIKNADFSKADIIPVLGKIKEVTPEIILKEFIEFCETPQE